MDATFIDTQPLSRGQQNSRLRIKRYRMRNLPLPRPFRLPAFPPRRSTSSLPFLWVVGCMVACTSCAWGQAETPALDEAQVKAWIEGLESDQLAVREWAKQQLLESGPQVIDALAERVTGVHVESTIRSLEVLQTLALDDLQTSQHAEQALRQIADNRVASGAIWAGQALRSIRVARTERAEKVLSRLGVEFSMSAVAGNAYASSLPVVKNVTFGERWTGTLEDMVYLRWLAADQEVYVEGRGPHITDAWLEEIAQLENVVGLKLHHAAVTDQGMQAIKAMPRIREVRVFFCAVSGAWLKIVDDKVPSLRSIWAIGLLASDAELKQVSQELKRLSQKHPGLMTRFGRGAFLGITGGVGKGEGCVVGKVTPNAAASKAGIMDNDLILEYEGQRVFEFSPPLPVAPQGPFPPVPQDDEQRPPSLSELIGRNSPGDRVRMKIKRDGRPFDVEVVLGEWL